MKSQITRRNSKIIPLLEGATITGVVEYDSKIFCLKLLYPDGSKREFMFSPWREVGSADANIICSLIEYDENYNEVEQISSISGTPDSPKFN